MSDVTRVISFSVKPGDKLNTDNVDKLKAHSDKTGVSFSYLVLKGIAKVIEELKI